MKWKGKVLDKTLLKMCVFLRRICLFEAFSWNVVCFTIIMAIIKEKSYVQDWKLFLCFQENKTTKIKLSAAITATLFFWKYKDIKNFIKKIEFS